MLRLYMIVEREFPESGAVVRAADAGQAISLVRTSGLFFGANSEDLRSTPIGMGLGDPEILVAGRVVPNAKGCASVVLPKGQMEFVLPVSEPATTPASVPFEPTPGLPAYAKTGRKPRKPRPPRQPRDKAKGLF